MKINYFFCPFSKIPIPKRRNTSEGEPAPQASSFVNKLISISEAAYMKWLRKNLAVDGGDYLKGFLGLDWLPSDAAKRNKRVYEESVEQLVKQLNGPASSFWVLKEIETANKSLIIKPWHHDPAKDSKTETHYMAYGEPDSYADASAKGEFAKTLEISDMSKSERAANMGTGAGTNYTLYFTPYYVGDSRPKGPAWGADEVLLHELVHGLNSLKGNLRLTGGAPDGFDGLEEFTAIVITNLFTSQTKRGLRFDHNGHSPMPANLCDPQNFYNKYRDAMQDCFKYHKSLTNIYKGWDAAFVPFNPFRFCT
jgi:hypothetical protein